MQESLIYLRRPHNDFEKTEIAVENICPGPHTTGTNENGIRLKKKKRKKGEQKGEQLDTERGSNGVNAFGHQQRGR